MSYSGIGGAIDAMFKLLIVSFFVAWPLAIWKLVEIIIWVYRHLEWVGK